MDHGRAKLAKMQSTKKAPDKTEAPRSNKWDYL